ncbi:hypothetical protein HOLleu_44073 [Holothuria leucospilota]|uniref:Endonuclease/exonuclease/phosphatase domain-containing protein n=1 Tax=Holothuria leucospilota TaxID=206669 RepID=A0A9Q0YAZ5_HOLLE|nr:hypothetical protein HOLleu_44073 [Holothuria leucospilota]
MPGGRPKGSVNRKRLEDSNSQRKLTPSPTGLSTSRSNRTRDDSESDTVQDFASEVNQSVDRLRRTLLREINTLQDDFNKAILDLRHTIDELTTEIATLKQKCAALDQKVVKLEEASKLHDQQINKQERFSRRSNVRIVGVDSSEGENCLQIAAQIFEEAGVPQCKIERAHRDGKFVEGRNRHILVKCTFFQDKISILRNARNALQSKPYFIIDDLTQVDLREKRKWSNKVQDLFRNGTRLHFSGGSWRDTSAGDFNFVFNLSLDKQGGDSRTNFKARDECLQAMFEFDLIDVWRERNPLTKAFSWHSNIADIHCRLDFFLITRSLGPKVKVCDFQPPIQSDHSLVTLGLQLSDEPRGKGFWKFNNSLLADKNYVDTINELIDSEIINTVHLNPSSRWDFIKYKIRAYTIGYSKRKAQFLRKRENDILLTISTLERQLIDSRPNSQETSRKLNNAKNDLNLLYKHKLEGIIVRSRARWVESGEKNSRYFLNLERRNKVNNTINKLNTGTGYITKNDDILAELRNFYSKLYSSRYCNCYDIFSFIPPFMSDDFNFEMCEGQLTIDECHSSLCSMPNGKTPGSDGFSTDFYKFFWSRISQLVVNSLNYAYENHSLSNEQCRGVITVLCKPNKDPFFNQL